MLTLDANVWVAALDPHDRFHTLSVRFLRHLAAEGVPLLGPAAVLVEVACAVARRSGDPDAGRRAADLLRRHPRLTLEPVTDRLLAAAIDLGSRARLRGADALYAAAAVLRGGTLVSWGRRAHRPRRRHDAGGMASGPGVALLHHALLHVTVRP